jgi:hypothetical protein
VLKALFGGGKPDHPMGDPKEAKRILEELTTGDANKALEELAHWHESVSTVPGFKLDARAQLLVQLDDAAQPRVRKLAREYMGAGRLSRVIENRLWTHAHEYNRQAGQAFARCIDEFIKEPKAADPAKAQFPLLLVRALRSFAQQLKWMHLRYGPVDPAVWGTINGLYAIAESRKLTDTPVVLYQGSPETTARLEFLRAAMFSAGAPDSLLPKEVELAERLIGDFAARFTLAALPAPELPYWLDLSKPMAPLRAGKPSGGGAGFRFLGGGEALVALQAMIQKIEATGQIPSGVNLGDKYEPEFALDLLQHLAMYWSPVPPERRHPRHSVKSRLSVAHSFEGVLQALGGDGSELTPEAVSTEAWVVENVSAGGFGAMVPQIKGDWLKVGALLAMQPEGGRNWLVGLVRRVSRTTGQQARVGIQTLSRSPVVSRFSMRGADGEPGIILPGDVPGSTETSIALRPAVFVNGINLEAARGDKQHVYMPLGIAEKSDDYEIARYREMIRDS